MIEILGAVYLFCLLSSAALVAWQFHHVRQTLDSESTRNINSHLSQLGIFWSHSTNDFSELKEDSLSKDRKHSLRSVLLLGLLGFGSFIGFSLLLAVVLSLRYLAKSRKEIKLYESALASKALLAKEEISEIVNSLKQIN